MRQITKTILAGLFGLMMTASAVLAQSSGVPEELLKNTRRQQGDSLTICNDMSSGLRSFDRDIAQALGDALFLKVDFQEGFGGFPLSGDGFIQELEIAMSNTCDLMMGISVQEETPFPEWASITRPYVSMPYVLAVIEPDWKALADIPHDRFIGTAMQSIGELVYITWSQQQPEAARWKRLPYADIELMLKRVNDGRLAGMLLWQPTFARLKQSNPDAEKLRLIDVKPVPETVTKVGALVSSRDSFLRTQIDQAIDALVEDGTIAEIMKKYGYEGTPGDAKR